MKRRTTKRASARRKTTKRKATKRTSAKRKATKRPSSKRPSPKRQSTKRRSTERRSVYEFEKQNVVSIWVTIVPLNKVPQDYFEMRDDDNDEAYTPFSEHFGFGWYNHDSVEANSVEAGPKSFEQLIAECSYSPSFVKEAVAAAQEQKLDAAEGVFLLYDIDYRPKVTRVRKSPYMAYLGSFRYDPEGANVF
jgi:hypothetical protein